MKVPEGRARPRLEVPSQMERSYSLGSERFFMDGDLEIRKDGVFIEGERSRPASGTGSVTSVLSDRPWSGMSSDDSSRVTTARGLDSPRVGTSNLATTYPGTRGGSRAARWWSARSASTSASSRGSSMSTPGGALNDSMGGSGAFGVSLEDLEEVRTLGRGSSGMVRLVRHRQTGNPLALKQITMEIDEVSRHNILQEVRALHESFCQHTVMYHGAFYDEGTIKIVFEYMDGGSLLDVIASASGQAASPGGGDASLKRRNIVPERVLRDIAWQVVEGLTYLKTTMNVIHRDIKPSNILVNTAGEVKISDFGVSAQLDSESDKSDSWVGTLTYMSPERIQGQPYSFNGDVWSLGLTLLECAIGMYPYAAERPEGSGPFGFWDLLERVSKGPTPNVDQFLSEASEANPDGFSPDFLNFVALCLEKDPEKRPDADVLAKHPFVTLGEGENPFSNVCAWVREHSPHALQPSP